MIFYFIEKFLYVSCDCDYNSNFDIAEKYD